jgi:hypothetical protein
MCMKRANIVNNSILSDKKIERTGIPSSFRAGTNCIKMKIALATFFCKTRTYNSLNGNFMFDEMDLRPFASWNSLRLSQKWYFGMFCHAER